MKIAIIEPDLASGEYFLNVVNRGENIQVRRCLVNIAPRVLGNKLNHDQRVTEDFQKAVDDCLIGGENAMVVACNTLQLWLPKISTKGVKVITTFDAVDWKMNRTKLVPLWLGTWLLVEEITRINKYITLLSENREDLQNKLQEIIWRVKAVEGSDVSGAGIMEEIDSVDRLVSVASLFFESLKESEIKVIVLGCTELPLLVKKYIAGFDFGDIVLWDPAELILEMLEN